MRPSTSLGTKCLSSMAAFLFSAATVESVKPSREQAVKIAGCQALPQSVRSTAPAQLDRTREFRADRIFQHGREMLVHPIADRRLHALYDRLGIVAEPLPQHRAKRLTHRPLENRFKWQPAHRRGRT